MSKRKKNKKFRLFLLFLFLLSLIGFIIFILGAYVFDTKIKTVIIHDNDIISDDEVVSIAFPKGMHSNFFLVNSNGIEKRLEKNDFISDALVKRKLLFEVHIYVTEDKPLFVREDTNKIVLSSGKEISNSTNYNFTIPSLINYVPNTKYKSLINKMNKIDYEIISKISDIKYYPNKYDEDRFVLYMNDSNLVYINLPKFKNINKYDQMVEKFEGKRGTLYLDSGNYFKVAK